MRKFIGGLTIWFVLCVIGLYAAGWLTYRHDDSKTVIEVHTHDIEQAAGDVVEKGRDLLEGVRERPVRTEDAPPEDEWERAEEEPRSLPRHRREGPIT